MKNDKKFDTGILFVIILTVIILSLCLGATFMTPISEKMTCDENYICRIEHQYLLHKKKEQIILDKDKSSASYRLRQPTQVGGKYSSEYIGNHLYLVVRDKYGILREPFTKTVESITFDVSLKTNIEISQLEDVVSQRTQKKADTLKQKFAEYLNNPSKGFKISSKASLFDALWGWIIPFGFISVFVLSSILASFDKKKQESKK